MILCLTKKVQDLFHVDNLTNYPQKDDYMWHVTVEFYDKKRLFVFTHVTTSYTLIFYGLKTKHLKNIKLFFKESLKKALIFDGFTPTAADAFLEHQGSVSFGKTNNRSIISNTTQRKFSAYGFLDHINIDDVFQKITSHRINQMLGIGYKTPRELMEELIQTLLDVTSSHVGYELDITINLENENVMRRVIVPNYYTLDDLHIVIQKVFGWKNMHLHEFINLKSNKSFTPLYDDIDGFEHSFNSKSISLDQAFDTFDEWVYTYDFGDDWKHHIFCRMSIHQKDPIRSLCTHFEGENIPEDVGGITGYQSFKAIMKNKNHNDYRFYKNWLTEIEYEPFDHLFVNMSLTKEWPLGLKSSLLKLMSNNKPDLKDH